ncbi:MAG TPA: hypothetical protein VGM92_07375 [Candidatus Kapabacteria bacterium]|jgi:hypothetical protein
MISSRIALFVLLSAAVLSCKSTSTGTNLPGSSDTTFLLKNASFDSAGTHGFNGWSFHHSLDTTDFEQDAPPGAGIWGFKIHSVDFPFQSDNITQSFTNLSSGVYAFTLWSHTKYVFPDSIFHPSWVSITKTTASGSSTTLIDSIPCSLTWFPSTMLDTLTLLPTDTVTLEISSGLAIVHGNPNTVDDFTFARLP